ncbi:MULTISPECIES: aldehyde dehydrogenase family protein [unclassified Microbacterium]|uniref:aldehyde dehydrogenase family protein n=1 Tax=unclassified Microbacterium TaxID=2609290 RepID=UPI00214C1428|nr:MULTISPECIES: aldehyde dehydrogenase family protein [unclassified Microbacterium]MCR2800270.1 aldehyde dehydrogenase family protein [Microbacterium sp. zg.Y818]MCR2824339.1 aldehyde dehydrogenase family protein [Microbacterium sp. zg.Y909]WIM22233.1 aldehyde dehydrogenase family protein [Microbacterium sp. zg-Y818]
MTADAITTGARTGLYIGGRERFTDETLTIVDPAKPGVVVGEAASASAADVADAVAAAKTAHPAWDALGAKERARIMAEAIVGIADERDEDAAILSQENGKVRFEAWVDALVFELRWNLALMLADEVETPRTLPVIPGAIPVSTEVSYQSLGVVTVIVPFNWPIAILGASLPHALLAGNTVIVKPPPSAPLATTRVTQRLAEKLPAGVLNVVTGDNDNAAGLIQNTDVAKVSFTGSVAGGKRVMEMASKTLTRVMLELGGNDAAIFLEDAVIDDVHLDRLFAAVYDTTGQICMNAKRVYVHRSRLDEVVAGLTARLEKVVLGHGLDAGTTMGPLHQPAQKAFVEEIIAEAKDAGADVREFGDLPGGDLAGGNFLRPALVVDPPLHLRVVTQEQFGPVIPLIPFDTEDEAVRLANDTWAGLGGSVWTASPEAAHRVGSALQCGYVWVNDHGATRLDLRAPFGGMKQSGMGREQGIDGVRAFQDTRSIATIDPQALAAMAH